jgi:hypothetical protein
MGRAFCHKPRAPPASPANEATRTQQPCIPENGNVKSKIDDAKISHHDTEKSLTKKYRPPPFVTTNQQLEQKIILATGFPITAKKSPPSSDGRLRSSSPPSEECKQCHEESDQAQHQCDSAASIASVSRNQRAEDQKQRERQKVVHLPVAKKTLPFVGSHSNDLPSRYDPRKYRTARRDTAFLVRNLFLLSNQYVRTYMLQINLAASSSPIGIRSPLAFQLQSAHHRNRLSLFTAAHSSHVAPQV